MTIIQGVLQRIVRRTAAGYVCAAAIAALSMVVPVFSYGGDMDDLMCAARDGDLYRAQLLLDRGVKVNGRDCSGQTAMGVATYYGNREMIQLFLRRGADVNATRFDGATPLMIAAQNGCPVMVKYLLDQGAEVNRKSKQGKTVLMYAQESNRRKVVELLRSAGAK